MRAQTINEYGARDVLRLGEQPAPTAGSGEVRVRVAYAALNPVEWKIRSGALAAMLPLVTVADFTAVAKGVRLADGDPWALLADSFAPELQLAGDGQYATEVAAEMALDALADAHALSETGHLRGKILIRVGGDRLDLPAHQAR